MKNKRKLIGYKHLAHLEQLSSLGVPVAKLIRDHNLGISRPHLAKLLSYYTVSLCNKTVESSLFPGWVDNERTGIQEQPSNYRYKGTFPYGKWELTK